MARGINKMTIIGNLGADPMVHTFDDGNQVANFSVGVGEQWTDRAGKKQERTEWFRCVARGKLAAVVNEWLTKGQQVYVEGPARLHEYTDREGTPRASIEIAVMTMQMLGGGKSQQQADDQPAKPAARAPAPAPAPAPSAGDFNDDIPF